MMQHLSLPQPSLLAAAMKKPKPIRMWKGGVRLRRCTHLQGVLHQAESRRRSSKVRREPETGAAPRRASTQLKKGTAGREDQQQKLRGELHPARTTAKRRTERERERGQDRQTHRQKTKTKEQLSRHKAGNLKGDC